MLVLMMGSGMTVRAETDAQRLVRQETQRLLEEMHLEEIQEQQDLAQRGDEGTEDGGCVADLGSEKIGHRDVTSFCRAHQIR